MAENWSDVYDRDRARNDALCGHAVPSADELKRLVPCVVGGDGLLRTLPLPPANKLAQTAYLWNVDQWQEAYALDAVGEPFAEFGTLHDFGAPVFFKPSLTEVFGQLPQAAVEALRSHPQRRVLVTTEHVGFAPSSTHHTGMTRMWWLPDGLEPVRRNDANAATNAATTAEAQG
jgi:hypothetical protein